MLTLIIYFCVFLFVSGAEMGKHIRTMNHANYYVN